MKFSFLYKSTATSAWPWPACVHSPDTLSFRENPNTNTDDSAVVGGLRSDRLIFEPGETSSIMGERMKSPGNFLCKRMAIDSRDPFTDFRASMAEMVEAHGLEDWDRLEELLSCYLRVNRKCNYGFIVEAFVDLVLHFTNHCPSSNAVIDEKRSSSLTATQCSFNSPLSFSSTNSSISPCSSSGV